MHPFAPLHSLQELTEFRRILLYPAASGAAYFLEFLRAQHGDICSRILCLGDRDPNKIGLLQSGLPVIAPADIPASQPDAVIVCSPELFESLADTFRATLGPQTPIFLADYFVEYLDWEARASALSRRPFDPATREAFPFAHAPRFFHSMPLGNGVYPVSTKGMLTYRLLEQCRFPADLTGKTVLDLGAADGFYSLEAKARGAAAVTAVDWLYWKDSDGLQRFRWLQQGYGLEVETRLQDVNAIAAEDFEPVDVVLLLGLYYHLQDPFRVFRELRRLARERVIITGRTIRAALPDPFHSHGRQASVMVLSDNQAGKWTANTHCLLDLLRLAGYSRAEVVFDFCPDGSSIASTAIHAMV